MKTIIISAVNIIEGGPLSILNECLNQCGLLCQKEKIKVIVLVNSTRLVENENFEVHSFPKAKKSWFNRVLTEYFIFKKFSRKYNVDLWISLHDSTPNVISSKRVVYMHNPSPFYKSKIGELFTDSKFYLFTKFYKYLYRINIHKNDYLIVQQDWLRKSFSKMYQFPVEKIIVAPPFSVEKTFIKSIKTDKINFFFPAFPRTFKNFEVICKAAQRLALHNDLFSVFLTIDGTENKYSKKIVKKYMKVKNIHFLGLLPKKEIDDLYSKTTCLIFPSKLETWGLPISEFSCYQKPMIVADLAYTRETSCLAKNVAFFNPDNDKDLAKLMKEVIMNKLDSFQPGKNIKIEEPYADSWASLFKILLK